MSSVIRPPAVAGLFYPGESSALIRELDRCLSSSAAKQKAMAIVVPHAGYRYSGAVAGEVYGSVELPERFIILSPNHTGEGFPYALMSEGTWLTPLGPAAIDHELATRFGQRCPLLKDDLGAHRREHSLEVQLPFLQRLRKHFSFVPLTLGYISYGKCEAIGRALAQTIRETPEPVLIIASSDMNHYENQKTTDKKDALAIREIEKLDAKSLYETVSREGISMCGIIPATVALIASRELGAKKAKLTRHATSGDITGEFESVVGYAGIVIE